MPPTCILLICPDPAGLAAMAAPLAGEYPVLTATSPASALGLIARHGPCDAALCQMTGDPLAGLACAERLSQASPGIIVTVLVTPPCPPSLLRAMAEGRIDDVWLLPLGSETLRQKTEHALAGLRRRHDREDSLAVILTRDEVNFLLGRGDDSRTACRNGRFPA